MRPGPVAQIVSYYRSLGRAWLGLPPRRKSDLYAWSFRQMALLWDRPLFMGKTFGEFILSCPEGEGLKGFTLRPIAFLGLSAWPMIALVLSRRRDPREWWRNWRIALDRIDLFVAIGRGPFTWDDCDGTPTSALHVVAGQYQYCHHHSAGFEIDDKRVFHALCRKHELPTVPVVDEAELVADTEYVAKPACSGQGKGVVLLAGKKARETLDLSRYVLQPRLQNHSAIAAVAGTGAGLCTLRVVTLNVGGSPRVFGTAFRFARAGSLVDNIHAGGVMSAVDLESGVTLAGATDALMRADWRNMRSLEAHPDTGVVFAKTLVLPHFNAAIELCVKAHRAFASDMFLCGWDVVLQAEGPLLLEGASYLAGGLEALHRPDYPLYLECMLTQINTLMAR